MAEALKRLASEGVDQARTASLLDAALIVPVLTAHTTADGLVVPQDETAYADVVRSAGKQDLLRQAFVHRAGHCAFTSAEVISLIQVMLRRLDSGRWDDASLRPAALNVTALALARIFAP